MGRFIKLWDVARLPMRIVQFLCQKIASVIGVHCYKTILSCLIIFIVIIGSSAFKCKLKPNVLHVYDAFFPIGAKSEKIEKRFAIDHFELRKVKRVRRSTSRMGVMKKVDSLEVIVRDFELITWNDLDSLCIRLKKICDFVLNRFNVTSKDESENFTYNDMCPYNTQPEICEPKKVCSGFSVTCGLAKRIFSNLRMEDKIDAKTVSRYLPNDATLLHLIQRDRFIFVEFRIFSYNCPIEIAEKWSRLSVYTIHKLFNSNSSHQMECGVYSTTYAKKEEKEIVEDVIPLLIITLVIMVITAFTVTIKFNFWYSRYLTSFAALVTSTLAILGGFSLGILFSFNLIVLHCAIPFVIIGIGLDSSFLIVHGALNILKSKSATSSQDFIIKTIDNCFMSVTMSDLTAILSFTVGSFTPFIAVNSVCRYLALSVACLWFAELFFFIPCLALKFQSHFKETNRERLEEMDANVFNVYEKYVNFLISFPASAGLKVQLFVKLFFILIFVGTLSFSIYSLIKMRKFADNLEAYNDNSIIKKFQKVALDSAAGYYFPTHLVFNKRLNLSDSSVLKQVQLAGNYISSSPLFTASETIEWLIELSNRTNISDINNYISNLKNNQFVDVKEIDNSYILMPRIYVTYRYNPLSGNIEEESKIIKAIFAFEDKFYDKIGSYFYDYKFSVMERDSLLVCSVWKSLLIAFACCIATVAIFIPNIWVLMTVVFLTASTTIMVLGLMAALGMTYSTSTYLMMLLAVGLCIDYIAHSGRFFFSVPRTHPNRCLLTQLDVGVPLFNAALSSFIGISALLFGNSPAIRNISKCLAIVFLVSFLNSVFVLPYLLTLRDTIKSLLKKYKPDSDA